MVVNILTHSRQLRFSLLIVLWLFSASFAPKIIAAELQLQIDTSNISIDEAFEISIISNGSTSGSIDISGLEEEFEIIDQYKQSSMNIINGHVSQSSTWIYTVVAKRAGKITIPAISVGNDSTQAVEINVRNSSVQASGSEDIILEVDIEQSTPYVQGQFIYVQRLLFAKDFRSNSTLTYPRLIKGRAEIEPLGNTPKRIVQRNGRDYRTITRSFAIIPQESGELVLAPSVFSGTLRRESQRNMNTFSYSTRSKRVRVHSKEVSINVKPRPAEFTGSDWIVAKNFSLHLNWPIPTDELKAGDPITVVLAAIADGLRAEQLPEIKLQAPSGIKLYPEKPTFSNIKNLDGIVGTMNQSIVLIATGGGEFMLPAINIPWWNSQTEKQEIATLKAVKLKISGAAAVTPVQKVLATPELEKKVVTKTDQKKSSLSNTLITLLILATLLLIILFLIVLKHWQGKAKNNNSTHTDKVYSPAEQQKIFQALKKACIDNNLQQAQKNIHEWQKSMGNPPLMHDDYLQTHIKALNQSLYGKTTKQWQGHGLWQAVEKYQVWTDQQAKNKKTSTNESLESLYL
ncbi:MAG TPA: protein BatD [Leucothrix mucor]|nr:protein BatD [Leucothrix mucor]